MTKALMNVMTNAKTVSPKIRRSLQLALTGVGLVSILASRDARAEGEAPASTGAHSGFFLEPGVTYEIGSTKTNYGSWSRGLLNDSTGEANGFGVVGRAGFHLNETFFVGLDGRYSRPNYKDSSNNLSAEAEAYSLAPVVGAQMPNVGLRAWAGYVMAAQLNPKETGSYDLKFKDGSGFLLGAGFRLAAVRLNLEYKDVRFGSTDYEKLPLGFTASGTGVTAQDQAWVASVTFPMEL